MKTCARCGEAKPLESFHRNCCRRDGVQTYCKACEQSTEIRVQRRARRKTPMSRASRAAYKRQWLRRNVGRKTRAREHLYRAVKTGKIQRLPCRVCGDPRSHGHHRDYTKPLEVDWLCAFHHAQEERTL